MVVGHLLVGGLGQPVPGGDHHIDEEVELSDQQAPDRATHQMGHDLHVRGADRPGPGVGQHQYLGVLGRQIPVPGAADDSLNPG